MVPLPAWVNGSQAFSFRTHQVTALQMGSVARKDAAGVPYYIAIEGHPHGHATKHPATGWTPSRQDLLKKKLRSRQDMACRQQLRAAACRPRRGSQLGAAKHLGQLARCGRHEGLAQQGQVSHELHA